jgi:hypothetical protein
MWPVGTGVVVVFAMAIAACSCAGSDSSEAGHQQSTEAESTSTTGRRLVGRRGLDGGERWCPQASPRRASGNRPRKPMTPMPRRDMSSAEITGTAQVVAQVQALQADMARACGPALSPDGSRRDVRPPQRDGFRDPSRHKGEGNGAPARPQRPNVGTSTTPVPRRATSGRDPVTPTRVPRHLWLAQAGR